MTSSQYKENIERTLYETKAYNESISVIREIFDKCGIEFPYGTNMGIMQALSSGYFLCWRLCTHTDAQLFVNQGVPVVGISSSHMIVIEPEICSIRNDETDVQNSCKKNRSRYVRQISSMNSEEYEEFQFFAYSLGKPEV
ncbi:MAG: hypothetical protein FWD44_01235 [Oscillospiraceae bacterium]|nr:hypothetical protein [Oscillospiraceae bacterium]